MLRTLLLLLVLAAPAVAGGVNRGDVLMGRPVSTSAPAIGDIYSWTGTAWGPTATLVNYVLVNPTVTSTLTWSDNAASPAATGTMARNGDAWQVRDSGGVATLVDRLYSGYTLQSGARSMNLAYGFHTSLNDSTLNVTIDAAHELDAWKTAFYSTTESVSITNTTALTDFGTVWSVTGGTIAANDRYQVDIYGRWSTDPSTATTIKLALRYNGTTLAATRTMTAVAGLTNAPWEFHAVVSFPSTSTAVANCNAGMDVGGDLDVTARGTSAGTVSVDTSASGGFGPAAQWGAASTSYSIVAEQIQITRLTN